MALASTTTALAHPSVEHLRNPTMADDNHAATDADIYAAKGDSAYIDALALTTAVAHNDISMVKALLKREIDLRPVKWDDTPALVTAAQKSFFEIVQLLVAAGANVNTGYDRLPLHSAAENGNLPIVRCLLDAGAYPEAQDSRGYTALVAAAATGQLAIIKCLLSYHQRISIAEIEQAMSLAAQGRHQSVCAFIQATFLPEQAEPQKKPAVQDQAPAMMSVLEELIEKSALELSQTLFSESEFSESGK